MERLEQKLDIQVDTLKVPDLALANKHSNDEHHNGERDIDIPYTSGRHTDEIKQGNFLSEHIHPQDI